MKDHIKKLQDVSGMLFVWVFGLNFVYSILLIINVIHYVTWFAYIVGPLALAGFIILRYLSSDLTSDLFSVGQACLELFFIFALPILMAQLAQENESLTFIFNICILFCILCVYFWSILLANNKFGSNVWWLIFLPLNYIINIGHYQAFLSSFAHTEATLTGGLLDCLPMKIFGCALTFYSAIGYWKLCHCECFSRHDRIVMDQSLSPFNRYTVTYFVVIAIVLWLF